MPGLAMAVLAQLPESNARGDIVPFLVVFLVGFVVAIAGHLMNSRDLILAGILIAGAAATVPWLIWG